MSADERDRSDPLARFATEFHKPPGQIYLDGNSLGLLCRSAEAALHEAIESWRTRAILGWTEGPEPWFELSRKAAALLAPILGVDPADVLVGQSTTINLHQLLCTYFDPARPRILIDEWSFPTDRYAVESHLQLRGREPARDLVVVPARDALLTDEDLIAAMDESVGLAVLPTVVFRTGQLLDVARLTEAAQRRGVRIIWDASHTAGVVPHRFRNDDIELAVGCTYKFLNGGPGSVGWLYAHPAIRDRSPGLAGWFGVEPARQFDMASEFYPAQDAGRFLLGTPHVLSLAPVVGALQVILDAGVAAIREKSLALTQFLREQVEVRVKRFGIRVVTPKEGHRRGGHVTLSHPAAGKLTLVLRARGVIPDFRPPDLLRLAPSPLYASFAECARAVDILEDILTHNTHEQLPDRHAQVT